MLVLLFGNLPVAGGEQNDRIEGPGLSSAQIVETAGPKGGLVVHIGCGDGRKTAELAKAGARLVHGLEAEKRLVEEA